MGGKPLNFEFVDGQEEQTTEISVTNEESVNE